MFELLEMYKNRGCFDFAIGDNLKEKCQQEEIPDNCCGIYVVYACFDEKEVPVYIGSSGHMEDDEIIPRIGGMRRRIRGKQKDIHSGASIPRGELWPELMRKQSIDNLKVAWYNTERDNPLIVEYCLLLEFVIRYKRLPAWNNELKLDGRLKGDLERFIESSNIEALLSPESCRKT